MPSADDILAGLRRAADGAYVLGVIWHVVIALAVVWLVALRPSDIAWRSRPRIAGFVVALPVVSASAVAFAFQDPFNGFGLGVVAVAVAALAWPAPERPAPPRLPPRWATLTGAALLVYAWLYPHFVGAHGPLADLFAAPVGVVPCPSLALAAGAALVLDLAATPGGRGSAGVLAVAALAWGLFGALRLGVELDAGLVAGGVALAARAAWPRRSSTAAASRPRGAPVAASGASG